MVLAYKIPTPWWKGHGGHWFSWILGKGRKGAQNARAMERQADAYALRAIASREPFITGMEKLAELNLAERQPHPWIEFIFHSHPSIQKRIAFAQKFPA